VTLGPIQVALQVADALEACGLLYLVGGSVARSIGGKPRTTLDVDMVVAMAETDVDAPKRSRTIPNRSDRICPLGAFGAGIRSALLDSLLTRANKCLDLASQRENLLARRFAEVPVVARLPLLKGTG
jgi:hypothetical protein